MSSKNSFNWEKKICFCKCVTSYRSVMSSALWRLEQRTYLFLFSNPFFFFKNETEAMEAIVFENSRSSSLPTAGDVSQGRTSLQLSDRNSILMT